MKLVIDIPEEAYKEVCGSYLSLKSKEEMRIAVKNGIPLENQKIGHCKDCDRWKQCKNGNNEDWYSAEGFCYNWRTRTGENFYCADFEGKENKE